MFRNNGISVLVVLVFLLQQPVLVLVFHSSSVVVSLGGWVRRGALWAAKCPISGSHSSAALCQPSASYCCRLCFLNVHLESCPSLLLQCNQSTPLSLLHVLFCSLFIIQCFLFSGLGSVCPRGYAGLSQGWLWEYHVLLICSPVDLRLPSKFGASIWWWALLVSQCNVAWRSFVWAGGLGCQILLILGGFFLLILGGSSISERFFSLWYLFFYYYSFIHMCVHCLGHFSPPSPYLTLSPPSPLSSWQVLFCLYH
jgi:hypothetical protein